jgi:hypothetical protein
LPVESWQRPIDKTPPAVPEIACDGSNINPVAVKILQLTLPGGGYLIPGSGVRICEPTPATRRRLSNPSIFRDPSGHGQHRYVINAKNTLAGRHEYETDIVNGPSRPSMPWSR